MPCYALPFLPFLPFLPALSTLPALPLPAAFGISLTLLTLRTLLALLQDEPRQGQPHRALPCLAASISQPQRYWLGDAGSITMQDRQLGQVPSVAVRIEGTQYLSHFVFAGSIGSVDVVRVRMLPGQTLVDWSVNAPPRRADLRRPRLPGPIGPETGTRPGVVVPPNSSPSPPRSSPLKPRTPPNLTALPVAMEEDGRVHRLLLLGAHLLIVGATGQARGT